MDHLSAQDYLREWTHRVIEIPNWFIEDVCGEVRGLGASRAELTAAANFLKYRKENIRTIIYGNREEFTSVADWGAMHMRPQRYLIAKYVPDVRRMEPVNIGVVVWSAGRTASRFLSAEEAAGVVNDQKTYKRWAM